MEDDLQWKMASNGKVEYLSNHWLDHPQILNLRGGLNQKQKWLKWRGPPMEDDLKILKFKYLRNHKLYLPQILNLSSGDQTEIKKAWNEDNLKWKTNLNILKVEYLSNHWSDLSPILNLSSGDTTKIKTTWNEDNLWVHHRGKLRGNLECGSAQPSLYYYNLILFVKQ
jgi:hypothetical protein